METIQIPNHTIIRKIGEGGMGTVYLAFDKILKRDVAIKALKSLREEDRQRFEAEAITLAKLWNPNITMLYNYNLLQDAPPWYMIMEYVEGETLESLLKKDGSLSVEKVLEIAVQTLEGLEHAHSKGVIHRDLKPANLMLSIDGKVKIMDFGIARIAGNSRLTQEGRAIGTVQYMSPEQVNGKAISYASDIYSLGIVLYELLTGVTPFDSGNEFEIMQAHTSTKPLPPDKINGNIPKALNAAILKALAKEPSARFADANKFKICLQQIAKQLVENSTPKSEFSESTLPQWMVTLKMEHQYLMGIGFLAASLIVALFVLFYPSSAPGKLPPVQIPPPSEEVNKNIERPSGQGMPNPVVEETKIVTPNSGTTSPKKYEETAKKPEQTRAIEQLKTDKKNKKDTNEQQEIQKDKFGTTSTVPILNVTLNESYDYDSAIDGAKIILSVSGSYVQSGQVVVASGARAYGIIRKNTQSKKLILIIQNVESVTGGTFRSESTYSDVSFPQGKQFKVTLQVE